MSEIEEILSTIKDESLSNAKNELIGFYNQAKDEQYDFVKETAEKTKKWLSLRLNNEINNDELVALLEARKRTIQQDLNTLEIQVRSKIEKIVFGIIDIISDKIITKLL